MFKLFSLFGVLALLLVAALDLPSVAAQNDEQTGRIVARLLDDGRVEFGWQPSGGSRVLPQSRYFPADPGHNRWLRSSPVEVNGAAIGRINARLLSNGRIEFAFTPTDGQRIAPQARYFPADARAGRWLRSTEIAIGPARAGYIAVSVGTLYNPDFSCAIRATGEIECWGQNGYYVSRDNPDHYTLPGLGRFIKTGQTDAPDGSYTAVSAGLQHTCAIRSAGGEITCWGGNDDKELTPPAGSYSTISTNQHSCAIRASDSAIDCWGRDSFGETDAPDGSYTAVSAGDGHTCAIRTTGEIACWGGNVRLNDAGNDWAYGGQSDPPPGKFRAVSAGRAHSCAIRESGEIECWGDNNGYRTSDGSIIKDPYFLGSLSYGYVGQSDPPPGKFRAVSAARDHTCAIRESGEIECWGENMYGQTDAPPGKFRAVSAGGRHSCAIREGDGAIECWGYNYYYGQTDAPAN